MDALRNTISTQSIKTKQIVFQYPDGSFPEKNAILNITDERGHTDWTRAPNLDSITLVDASGYEGVLTYTNDDSLLVNGVPVGGGGGGMVSGGTNIDVTGPAGNRVVNFDPSGGVDMLGNTLTNADRIEMGTTAGAVNPLLLMSAPAAGAGRNATIRMTDGTQTGEIRNDYAVSGVAMNLVAPIVRQTISTHAEVINETGSDAHTLYVDSVSNNAYVGLRGLNCILDSNRPIVLTSENLQNTRVTATMEGGALKIENGTDTPTIRTSTLSGANITATTDGVANTNTIAMTTTSGVGDSQITMTDGVANASVSFNGASDRFSINSTQNIAITVPNQTIEMGSLTGQLALLANNIPIRLRRNDASGAIKKTQIFLEDAGIVQIGDIDCSSNPGIKFQEFGTGVANTQLQMDASDALVISGSAGATVKIAMPLVDVATGTAGLAGQVLTTDGVNPPYWAGPGGGSTAKVVLTDISGSFDLSGSGLYKVDYTLTGGGGGGGSGRFTVSGGGSIRAGGGGGGGSGLIKTGTIYAIGSTSITYTVGAGGTGGNSVNGGDGGSSSITYYNNSETAAGGGGGLYPIPIYDGSGGGKGGTGYYGGGGGGWAYGPVSGGIGVVINGTDGSLVGTTGGSPPGGGIGGTNTGGGGGGGVGGGNGGIGSLLNSFGINGTNGSSIGAGGGGGATNSNGSVEGQGGSGAAGGLVLLYTLIG